MQVFQLHHDTRRVTLDIMASVPIGFDELWAEGVDVRLERTTVRVAAIDHLIRMKRDAGRPQDLTDVEALEAIERLIDEEEGEE